MASVSPRCATDLRKSRAKLVTVEANVASKTLNELVAEIQEKMKGIEFPPGYNIHYGGMFEFTQESFSSIFKSSRNVFTAS